MDFSYSTLADVYAMVDEYPDREQDLQAFGTELERMGIATFDGVEYMLRDTNYGQEIISMEDLASENEDEDDE